MMINPPSRSPRDEDEAAFEDKLRKMRERPADHSDNKISDKS